MIFSIVSLLKHAAWIQFFESPFLSTLIFTCSDASNSQLLHYQGRIL